MVETRVNPSTAANVGRYANMAFPGYKFAEYPKKITVAGKRVTVKDRAEEFDVKLKNAEVSKHDSLTRDEITALEREQSHNKEIQSMYEKHMDQEAEINRLKAELANAKGIVNPAQAKNPPQPSVRVDKGDHDDNAKQMHVDLKPADNKTEHAVHSPNKSPVETKGTAPSPTGGTATKP